MTFKFLVKNDQTTNDVTLVTNNSKFIFLEKKIQIHFPPKRMSSKFIKFGINEHQQQKIEKKNRK